MNNEWSTPQDLFDALNEEFGFSLDVCAQKWNHKCEKYYCSDSLERPWWGTCWMNPPYGREIGAWVKKAYETSLSGGTVVCLVPSRTETAWWHDYCMNGTVRFIRGRVWFTSEDGKTGRPRFGSAIVIFRPNEEAATA